MEILPIIIEKSQGRLWGRVDYQNNSFTDIATTAEGLEKKLRAQLRKYFHLDPAKIVFQRKYDLTALFIHFSFLKINAIANLCDIEPLVLRQYAAGIHFPSEEEVQKMEHLLRSIGQELLRAQIVIHKENK